MTFTLLRLAIGIYPKLLTNFVVIEKSLSHRKEFLSQVSDTIQSHHYMLQLRHT